MKKLNLLCTSLFLLTAASVMISCGMRGKGDVVSETVALATFSGITNNIDADIRITQAQVQSVEIVAQENITENISLEVADGVWTIDFVKENVAKHKPININISIPDLSSLNISGSGDMSTTNTFDSCGIVSLNISGSGNIYASFNSITKTYSSISGSGNITLSGNSPDHDITLSGSGNVYSFPFHTYHTIVSIPGSGNCELSAESTLYINISGSGNVYYKGNPVITQTITGSGGVYNVN